MLRPGPIYTRPARESDLDSLSRLEETCFDGNRISRRQFLYHIKKPGSGLILLAGKRLPLAGYALILLRKNSPRARLYSLAILPQMRGQGLAQKLIRACEAQSRKAGKSHMHLEVREDNLSAQQLYLKLGYRPAGFFKDYYEDRASALRLEKNLISESDRGAPFR